MTEEAIRFWAEYKALFPHYTKQRAEKVRCQNAREEKVHKHHAQVEVHEQKDKPKTSTEEYSLRKTCEQEDLLEKN